MQIHTKPKFEPQVTTAKYEMRLKMDFHKLIIKKKSS